MPRRTASGAPINKKIFRNTMDAERINYVYRTCEDLAHRLAELRGYL